MSLSPAQENEIRPNLIFCSLSNWIGILESTCTFDNQLGYLFVMSGMNTLLINHQDRNSGFYITGNERKVGYEMKSTDMKHFSIQRHNRDFCF